MKHKNVYILMNPELIAKEEEKLIIFDNDLFENILKKAKE